MINGSESAIHCLPFDAFDSWAQEQKLLSQGGSCKLGNAKILRTPVLGERHFLINQRKKLSSG